MRPRSPVKSAAITSNYRQSSRLVERPRMSNSSATDFSAEGLTFGVSTFSAHIDDVVTGRAVDHQYAADGGGDAAVREANTMAGAGLAADKSGLYDQLSADDTGGRP